MPFPRCQSYFISDPDLFSAEFLRVLYQLLRHQKLPVIFRHTSRKQRHPIRLHGLLIHMPDVNVWLIRSEREFRQTALLLYPIDVLRSAVRIQNICLFCRDTLILQMPGARHINLLLRHPVQKGNKHCRDRRKHCRGYNNPADRHNRPFPVPRQLAKRQFSYDIHILLHAFLLLSEAILPS